MYVGRFTPLNSGSTRGNALADCTLCALHWTADIDVFNLEPQFSWHSRWLIFPLRNQKSNDIAVFIRRGVRVRQTYRLHLVIGFSNHGREKIKTYCNEFGYIPYTLATPTHSLNLLKYLRLINYLENYSSGSFTQIITWLIKLYQLALLLN